MDSILTTIKKLVGVSEENDSFDLDIITYINSAFARLRRLGVGPTNGFRIQDATSVWTDFIPENDESVKFEDVKTYVYLKTKLKFDPPANSTLHAAMENSVKELEWLLNVDAESDS